MTNKEWLKSLVESIAPMFVAALLWAIMIVVVILATASAGNRWLEVLIAGIGAVGQVFFAWMVWRLGREQFAFTKAMTRRQARIDTFDHRTKLFDQYVALQPRLSFNALNEAAGIDYSQLATAMRRLFSAPTMVIVNELGAAVWAGVNLKEEIEEAAMDEARAHARFNTEKRDASTRIRNAKNSVYKAVQDELILEID